MPLCSFCKTIPFRAIAAARESEKNKQSWWMLDKQQVEDSAAIGSTETPGKWRRRTSDFDGGSQNILHTTLPEVTKNATGCDLCTVIVKATKCMEVFTDKEDLTGGSLKGYPGHHTWLVIPGESLELDFVVYYGDSSEPDIGGDGIDLLVRASPGSPFADIASVHLANTNPLHQSTLATIKAWVDVCTREHSNCRRIKEETVPLPTRLIDLVTLPNCDELGSVPCHEAAWRQLFKTAKCKLIETTPTLIGDYATVSYCWGKALPYTTTSRNLERHLAGLEFDWLPKTLQDAIMVARFLGFRYIWIDCVCIVQDDEEDWAREAACMANIYSNAALCIAASRASNCDEGFLHLREIGNWTHLCIEDKEGAFSLYVYESPECGYLMSQEWRPEAYQERLLSNRLLSFTSDGCTWKCCKVLSREDNVTSKTDKDLLNEVAESLQSDNGWPVVDPIQSQGDKWQPPLDWWSLIEQYQRLLLTDMTDKLPALSGIVARLQQTTGDVCYAGLWKKHFLRGLLWFTDPDTRHSENWLAPSWSFVAMVGEVQYGQTSKSLTFLMQLGECNLKSINISNPLGKLEAGSARLYCQLIPLLMIRFNGKVTSNKYLAADRFEGKMVPNDGSDIVIWLDDHSDFERLKAPHTPPMGDDDVVTCEALMVTTEHAIVAQTLDTARTKYTRLGLAYILRWPQDYSVSVFSKLRSVTLI